MMFGLRNKNGSCWINAALQGIFRIPDLQSRFSDGDEDGHNSVESCLAELWGSHGEEGLKAFYECVKVSPTMPAGEDIGDSHELLKFIWDKVPFLDKLVRFKASFASLTFNLGSVMAMRMDTIQSRAVWLNSGAPMERRDSRRSTSASRSLPPCPQERTSGTPTSS